LRDRFGGNFRKLVAKVQDFAFLKVNLGKLIGHLMVAAVCTLSLAAALAVLFIGISLMNLGFWSAFLLAFCVGCVTSTAVLVANLWSAYREDSLQETDAEATLQE
jgi:uncharacterized membrane protein YraQ (UPF0718 family)